MLVRGLMILTGAVEDCEKLSSIGLKNSKILAHTRCHMHDVKIAVNSGLFSRLRMY